MLNTHYIGTCRADIVYHKIIILVVNRVLDIEPRSEVPRSLAGIIDILLVARSLIHQLCRGKEGLNTLLIDAGTIHSTSEATELIDIMSIVVIEGVVDNRHERVIARHYPIANQTHQHKASTIAIVINDLTGDTVPHRTDSTILTHTGTYNLNDSLCSLAELGSILSVCFEEHHNTRQLAYRPAHIRGVSIVVSARLIAHQDSRREGAGFKPTAKDL